MKNLFIIVLILTGPGISKATTLSLAEEEGLQKAFSEPPNALHSTLSRLGTFIQSADFKKDSPIRDIVAQLDLNFPPDKPYDDNIKGLLHDTRHCLNDMEFAFSCLRTNNHDPVAISGLQQNFNDLKDMLEKVFKMPDGSIRQIKKSLENLFNLTESFLTCCSLLAKRFGVDFNYIPPEKLKNFILTQEMHSSMIKRILYNLMKNAMIYSAESKSPKVSLEIETEQKKDQWRAKFSVTDTGIGMSPQFIERSLFKEGSREKTTKQSGSGIGLSSCKTLVESMGGEIGASSEGLGKGSTFWFTVPVTTIQSVSVSTSPIVKLRANKQYMQVLIVDDDPVGRKMLHRQCTGLGLEHVESVATAEEALNFTGKTSCSLIFMDTNLGGKKDKKDKKDEIDGIELTKRILARTPPQTTPPRTISISGSPQSPAETGMDGVLPKPFDVKRLEMLLEKHFEFTKKNQSPSSST